MNCFVSNGSRWGSATFYFFTVWVVVGEVQYPKQTGVLWNEKYTLCFTRQYICFTITVLSGRIIHSHFKLKIKIYFLVIKKFHLPSRLQKKGTGWHLWLSDKTTESRMSITSLPQGYGRTSWGVCGFGHKFAVGGLTCFQVRPSSNCPLMVLYKRSSNFLRISVVCHHTEVYWRLGSSRLLDTVLGPDRYCAVWESLGVHPVCKIM